MKLALPVLAVLALALGAAQAADKPKAGFDALDRNNDGQLTRAEAAGDKRLLKGYDVADKNNDGRLSRGEYLAATGKRKVRDAFDKPSDPDPGFNALDKNDDGFISRREARGNPYLKKNFDLADKNNDGKLSRGEYVPEMLKKDLRTGKAKLEHSADRPRS